MNSNRKLTVIELRNYIEPRTRQVIRDESELILHAG